MPDPADSTAALPEAARLLNARATRVDVVLDGQRLAVRRWGAGRPLILFHGGHGSWLHWLRNIDALSADNALYLVDLPGFGESSACDFVSVASYSEALAPFIAALVPDERLVLGGFSLGSSIAVHLVPHFAERLDCLVMVGSPALTDAADHVRDDLVRWRSLPDPEERRRAHATNLGILMLHDTAAIDAEAVDLQSCMTTRARMRFRARTSRGEVRDTLLRTRPRTFGISGARDVLTRRHLASAETFLAGLDNGSALFAVPGAGHWVQYEAAETVNRIMLRMLATP